MADDALTTEYIRLLDDLKVRVRAARVQAALAANQELVLLYWHIGRGILERQDALGWGARVVDQLARDLRAEFPEMTGFSPRNLKYMRAFAEAWPDLEFVQQAAARIPWFHNATLLDKVKDPAVRRFYIEQTLVNGWSRNVLVVQIESRLHERQGAAPSNFAATLPAPQSDLAQQLVKDPYVFDFLTLADDARERELEQGLVEHVRDFLVELGVGFRASREAVSRAMRASHRAIQEGSYEAPSWSPSFEEAVEHCLQASLVSAFAVRDLRCRTPTPDFEAIRTFLQERFNHFVDDLEHDEKPRLPW